MAWAREKGQQRDIASERVMFLFEQAKGLAQAQQPKHASRRMRLAKNICLKCNFRLPKELKLCFCKKCLTYFTSATMQCRLNARQRRMETKCKACGHKAYRPYSRKLPVRDYA